MRPTSAVGRGIEQAVLKTPAVSNAWQLGTILKALVLSDSSDGAVRLQIGPRVMTAQTTLSLQTGQAIRLQVAETGRTVILKPAPDSRPGNAIRDGIRQSLPRQMPQAPLMSAALSLARPGTQFPANLSAAATRLVNAMREPGQLMQGQGLRLAVRDTGIFLEQKLAKLSMSADQRQNVALSRDWKAALLTFRDRLTQLHARPGAHEPANQPARLTTGTVAGSNQNARVPAQAVTITAARTVAAPVTAQPSAYPVPPAVPGTPLPAPASVAPGVSPTGPAPANPQSTPVAGATPASPQRSGAANNVSAPMRHALPQPQALVQHSELPADALKLVSELVSNTDGALARVRLNQLASIAPDHGSRLVWLLELPVRHADDRAEVVTLRIETDEQGNDENTQSAWTADLAFDLGTKGQLRARVALRAGRVSVSFWADADQTRTEVQGKLPQLKSAMKEKQLDVATLSAGAVRPETPAAPSASLLETRA